MEDYEDWYMAVVRRRPVQKDKSCHGLWSVSHKRNCFVNDGHKRASYQSYRLAIPYYSWQESMLRRWLVRTDSSCPLSLLLAWLQGWSYQGRQRGARGISPPQSTARVVRSLAEISTCYAAVEGTVCWCGPPSSLGEIGRAHV